MDKKLFGEFVLSCFFPKRCRYCGKPVDFRLSVCKSCIPELDEITGDICMLCGFAENDCECKKSKHYYTAVAAPYYYDGAAGKAVRRLKFGKDTDAAEALGEDMARCFAKRFADAGIDIITSVPLSAQSERKRGFNQSRLLALKVADAVGIQYGDLLFKYSDTRAQHTLSKAQRSGNLLGSFEVRGGADLSSMTILLCDDVKTTGATLDECAKTLLIAGADSVFCLCATITKPDASRKKHRRA